MPLSEFNTKQEAKQAHCHSRYAPELEARRHLDANLEGRQPALLFIIGAGRNFLGKVVRQILPGAMTVVLQTSTDFDDSLVDPGDLYWSPGATYPLESILASALSSGKASGGITLIEWPPAVRGHETVLKSIRDCLHQALEIYSSEAATSAYWGRRWIKNCIDFVCGKGPLALPGPGSLPVVIACAGPSLDDALPAIRKAGSLIRLWALASSHQALSCWGLEPELVIGTDPGFWNSAHMALAARKCSSLAATPSTKLGASILDGRCPIVPVCTGLGFELDALAAAGDIPSIEASASGTAAGTALSIAGALNSGPIYLCGLDLATKDLAEHTSPYAFDILDELNASREQPALASRFIRVMERFPRSQGLWRLSRAFSTYALEIASGTARSNVFRVSSSPIDTHLECITPERLASILATGQIISNPKTELRIFQRRLTVQARLEAMIDRLTTRAQRALGTLQKSASTGQPVPRETVLELFAFGGKGCSAAIAGTARGKVSRQELQEAENAVSSNLKHLAGGHG